MPSDRWRLPVASLPMFQVSLRFETGRSIYVLISLRGQNFTLHKSDSRLEDIPRLCHQSSVSKCASVHS